MKKFREYKQTGVSYRNLDEKQWTSAIKYKGKIYTGQNHPIIVDKLLDAGHSEKELDDNLDIDNFGYYNKKKGFIKGDSDYAGAMNDNRKYNISMKATTWI